MITIFHELKHFKDNYNILNNIYDDETIRILKEKLINFNQNEFEREILGKYASSNYYYKDNYDVESSEVLAEKYAYLDMIKYFDFIGVKLSDSELSSINNKIHVLDKKYNKKLRNLTHCLMYNNFYLNVDEAFDVAILNFASGKLTSAESTLCILIPPVTTLAVSSIVAVDFCVPSTSILFE